jgi:hypothetical protein
MLFHDIIQKREKRLKNENSQERIWNREYGGKKNRAIAEIARDKAKGFYRADAGNGVRY